MSLLSLPRAGADQQLPPELRRRLERTSERAQRLFCDYFQPRAVDHPRRRVLSARSEWAKVIGIHSTTQAGLYANELDNVELVRRLRRVGHLACHEVAPFVDSDHNSVDAVCDLLIEDHQAIYRALVDLATGGWALGTLDEFAEASNRPKALVESAIKQTFARKRLIRLHKAQWPLLLMELIKREAVGAQKQTPLVERLMAELAPHVDADFRDRARAIAPQLIKNLPTGLAWSDVRVLHYHAAAIVNPVDRAGLLVRVGQCAQDLQMRQSLVDQCLRFLEGEKKCIHFVRVDGSNRRFLRMGAAKIGGAAVKASNGARLAQLVGKRAAELGETGCVSLTIREIEIELDVSVSDARRAVSRVFDEQIMARWVGPKGQTHFGLDPSVPQPAPTAIERVCNELWYTDAWVVRAVDRLTDSGRGRPVTRAAVAKELRDWMAKRKLRSHHDRSDMPDGTFQIIVKRLVRKKILAVPATAGGCDLVTLRQKQTRHRGRFGAAKRVRDWIAFRLSKCDQADVGSTDRIAKKVQNVDPTTVQKVIKDDVATRRLVIVERRKGVLILSKGPAWPEDAAAASKLIGPSPPVPVASIKPQWRDKDGELRYDGQLLLTLRSQARDRWLLLTSLEEQSWAQETASPWPVTQRLESRVKDATKRLNKAQKAIKFSSLRRGRAVSWQPRSAI